MKQVKITVTDEQGVLFGQFTLDADSIGGSQSATLASIGEQVVAQLPGGLAYLRPVAE